MTDGADGRVESATDLSPNRCERVNRIHWLFKGSVSHQNRKNTQGTVT
jgi:hypothetical protein